LSILLRHHLSVLQCRADIGNQRLAVQRSGVSDSGVWCGRA
jgi:hypothetical protein